MSHFGYNNSLIPYFCDCDILFSQESDTLYSYSGPVPPCRKPGLDSSSSIRHITYRLHLVQFLNYIVLNDSEIVINNLIQILLHQVYRRTF